MTQPFLGGHMRTHVPAPVLTGSPPRESQSGNSLYADSTSPFMKLSHPQYPIHSPTPTWCKGTSGLSSSLQVIKLRFKEDKWLSQVTLLEGDKAGTRIMCSDTPCPGTQTQAVVFSSELTAAVRRTNRWTTSTLHTSRTTQPPLCPRDPEFQPSLYPSAYLFKHHFCSVSVW